MINFPIEYEGRVYRPPSEAKSLLFQVTVGCSNNKCTYCAMYRDKTYRERSIDDIHLDIEKARSFYAEQGMTPQKIFLCDGDALGAPTPLLVATLDKINQCFPAMRRIGAYSTASNILTKTPADLKLLASKKLSMAYLGMESGDDKVLKLVTKGNTAQDMMDAADKLKVAGWKLSVIAMLGLGGKKFSETHCENTAKAISYMTPEFFSFLITTPIPGTPYAKMVARDSWQVLSDREHLMEMRQIISNIDPKDKKIIFRANHVSNLHPLGGILPRDTALITETLSQWIQQCPKDQYTKMSAENL